MKIKRVFRKIERPDANKDLLHALRVALDTARPTLESLAKSGHYQIVKQGDYLDSMRHAGNELQNREGNN